MHNIKVSVCVPVYNVEAYIGRCLESILSQSLQEIEIIIVNDCTPDNSMEIVKDFAAQDKRIKIINHKTNMGLMWTRHTGYMSASGDYITFCDSDDILGDEALRLLYNSALKFNADIVSGNMQRFTGSKLLSSTYYSLPYGNNSEAVYKALLNKEYSHTLCSKLFKADLLRKYEYITLDNATNGEDGILFYQIVQHANKVIHIPEITYYYRSNPASSTNCRLKESGINSILYMQSIRQSIGRIYPSLYKSSWLYASEIINGLYAMGYNKDVDLNGMVCKYNLTEYVNLKQMFLHLQLKQFIKIILLRMLKPHYINYCIKRHEHMKKIDL